MRITLQIWIISALVESVCYSFILGIYALVPVLIVALIGGLLGALLFWFLLEAIHIRLEPTIKKWVGIIVAAIVCSNGVLVLFLMLTNLKLNELPFFEILNAAVCIAILISIPAIKKEYFKTPQKPIWDADIDRKPYVFQNLNNETNEKN